MEHPREAGLSDDRLRWQEQIVRRSREALDLAIPGASGSVGACLYQSHFLLQELQRDGVRGVVQAGNAHWQRVTDEKLRDESEHLTHVGYQWDPWSIESRVATKCGLLPEMHVWVGIPATRELVDLVPRQFGMLCEALGVPWEAPALPDYLWAQNYPGAIYGPDLAATVFAARLLWEMFEPAYLVTLAFPAPPVRGDLRPERLKELLDATVPH